MCTTILPDLTAFIAALLFAVHPIHTEAVSTRGAKMHAPIQCTKKKKQNPQQNVSLLLLQRSLLCCCCCWVWRKTDNDSLMDFHFASCFLFSHCRWLPSSFIAIDDDWLVLQFQHRLRVEKRVKYNAAQSSRRTTSSMGMMVWTEITPRWLSTRVFCASWVEGNSS